MKRWLLLVALMGLLALGAAACNDGGDGDENAEPAVDGDSLPQASDDARPAAAGEYRVTVSFNEDAVQADLDEIGGLLAVYDESTEYLIQESFPPTGVATLSTDADDFCETIVPEFETLGYVTAASCGPQVEPGEVEPDEDSVPGQLTSSDCDPVPLRSDCGIDPDVCNQVHNIDACPDGDLPGAQTSPVCAPGFPDCVDVLVDTCVEDACTGEDELPPAPPDARPSATGQYTVIISFNTSYDQADIDETDEILREYDADFEYLIQESFPPTGVASLTTDAAGFCDAIIDALDRESFVADVSCGPQLEPGDIADGDAPVSSTPLP